MKEDNAKKTLNALEEVAKEMNETKYIPFTKEEIIALKQGMKFYLDYIEPLDIIGLVIVTTKDIIQKLEEIEV